MSSNEKKSASTTWPSVSESNLDDWKKSAQKSAPNGNVDELGWKTPDGIHLKALYTSADTDGLQYANSLPGFARLTSCLAPVHGQISVPEGVLPRLRIRDD